MKLFENIVGKGGTAGKFVVWYRVENQEYVVAIANQVIRNTVRAIAFKCVNLKCDTR